MNCLVTKLKASVQNDNLLYLGKLRIDVTQNENSSDSAHRLFYVTADGGDVVVETPAGNYIGRTSSLNDVTNSITVTQAMGETGIYASAAADFSILISSSNLSKFLFSRDDSVFTFNLNRIDTLPHIQQLYLRNNAIGNIGHLHKLNTLTVLRMLNSAGVEGNVESLLDAIAPYKSDGDTLQYDFNGTGVISSFISLGVNTVTFDGAGGYTVH